MNRNIKLRAVRIALLLGLAVMPLVASSAGAAAREQVVSNLIIPLIRLPLSIMAVRPSLLISQARFIWSLRLPRQLTPAAFIPI